MTLSPDIRQTIVSHTSNMPPRERAFRLSSLCHKYGIVDGEDLREAARIAAVRIEDVKFQ